MFKKLAIILSVCVAILTLVIIAIGLQKKEIHSPEVAKRKYLALGDSVASGAGLPGSVDASACDRTDESYPYKLASQLNLEVISVACSGATIKGGLIGEQTINGIPIPRQLDSLSLRPDIVTMSIGANDVGWSDVLVRCFTGKCGTDKDTAESQNRYKQLTEDLTILMDEVNNALSQNTKVYVLGYYDIYPGTLEECANNSGVDSSELKWLRDQTSALNKTIEASVQMYATLTFVPINLASHELCTASPWIQSLQFPAPFHPTSEGQSEIANKLLQSINNSK